MGWQPLKKQKKTFNNIPHIYSHFLTVGVCVGVCVKNRVHKNGVHFSNIQKQNQPNIKIVVQ